MWETHECVQAGCDQCGDRCWEDWDYRPHWPSEPAARTELAEQDWQLEGERMLCARCAALEACRTLGHQFSAWVACLCGPGGDRRCASPAGSCPAHRWCERCWHFEEHPDPATGQGVA